ncbi:MAG TPA: VTT domain-containing protein [Afifellaceae bacterium]|nr:VTT domain-containing protein [Afifellaceae bacterium]
MSATSAASAAGRLFFTFLAVVVLVALPFFLWGERIEALFTGDGAVDQLSRYGSFAWAIAIVLLLSDLALPVPTTAVMSALGIIYGPWLGGAVAATGSVISGLAGYGLCRAFGRPLALWLSGAGALQDGERLFAGAGGWIILLSRWLPVLSEVMACMAGLARMPFALFLGALVCGSVPMGFVFAAIGHIGEDRPVMTLVVATVLPIVLWLAVRPLLRRWTQAAAAPGKG